MVETSQLITASASVCTQCLHAVRQASNAPLHQYQRPADCPCTPPLDMLALLHNIQLQIILIIVSYCIKENHVYLLKNAVYPVEKLDEKLVCDQDRIMNYGLNIPQLLKYSRITTLRRKIYPLISAEKVMC